MKTLNNVKEMAPQLAAALVVGHMGETTIKGESVSEVITAWYNHEIATPASEEAGDYFGKTLHFSNGRAHLSIKPDLTISVRMRMQAAKAA